VRVGETSVGCSAYDLTLDRAAKSAFTVVGCDVDTGVTQLRVTDRAPLFEIGDAVPRPRVVSVNAVVRQTATETGGGDVPHAASKIWCSVALEPYLWDGLRGVGVALPPDRYDLVPKDARVHAAPDGSGWVARGESRMDIYFRYEVRERSTGKTVLEDVATLSCRDAPVDGAKAGDADGGDALLAAMTAAARPHEDAVSPPPRPPPSLSFDTRFSVGGVTFGANDVQQQLGGVALGVGRRLSEKVYVGGSLRWVLDMDQGSNAGSLYQVLQTGLEARLVYRPGVVRTLANGRALGSGAQWVGFRGGVENVGLGTYGGFGELSWGWEWIVTRHVDYGMVLASGVGLDAPGAYGDATVVHPYTTMDLRVAFDL
jgi:hypothetical protein